LAARRTRKKQFARGNKNQKSSAPIEEPDGLDAQVAEVERPSLVALPDSISVGELAELIAMSPTELVGELFNRGIVANINAALDFETAALMLADMDIEAEHSAEEVTSVEEIPAEIRIPEPEGEIGARPAVVTVMGHVDHGKTTLLDAIRSSNVVDGEAGGITQKIGAYQVNIGDVPVTFIDTPGHEAFTAMRARGAEVTDIVVLVIAADDGVMPQTREAIAHAKAAEAPLVIAVNKIDVSGANPNKALAELAEAGVMVESMGGDVVSVQVSALKGTGIDDLLEMIQLTASLEEPKSRVNGDARGTVIETRLDRSQGPVATILVHAGSLGVGDAFVIGQQSGKVRSLTDHTGSRIKKAGPSDPVEVVGLGGMPSPGDMLAVMSTEKAAREIADSRASLAAREADSSLAERLGLEDLARQLTHGEIKQLDIVVKGDTNGAVDAVSSAVKGLDLETVHANVVYSGVGTVTENDVNLATAAKAVILGFNVKAHPSARALADQNGVEIRTYAIIYELIEEVEKALQGQLEPDVIEIIDGRLDVRGVFRSERAKKIIGGMVTEGKISRSLSVRVVREGEVLATGSIDTLRRFSDSVPEVNAGYECGLAITIKPEIKVGDVVEAFHEEERVPGI